MTLEEIEKQWKEHYGMPLANGDIDWLISQVKFLTVQNNDLRDDLAREKRRVKELEEGIRKHRAYSVGRKIDEELYKLLP